MDTSIAEVIRRFKREWTSLLDGETIRDICTEVGYCWRERVFDPVTTVHVFLTQLLHGNAALSYLPHLIGRNFSAAAFCLARARLPLSVFTTLVERIGRALQNEGCNEQLWHGHRVLIADGTGCSMPDTPELQEQFPQPPIQRQGCGFPVVRILALLHAGTGMILKVLTSSVSTHDITRVQELHPEFKANDILVADRAFCSYTHFCLLIQRGIHAVLRMHASQRFDFGPRGECVRVYTHTKIRKTIRLTKLGQCDQIVSWQKPVKAPRGQWLSQELFASLPEFLTVRQLQYAVAIPGFRSHTITLITTLLDADRYPLTNIAELYALRWSVEINFRHLKISMNMDVLHCTTLDGVLKEILMFCIIYNLVRLVILEASTQQNVHPSQISFIDALRWLATNGNLPLRLVVIPHRHPRFHPRCLKRRPKAFKFLRQPRQLLISRALSPTYALT